MYKSVDINANSVVEEVLKNISMERKVLANVQDIICPYYSLYDNTDSRGAEAQLTCCLALKCSHILYSLCIMLSCSKGVLKNG